MTSNQSALPLDVTPSPSLGGTGDLQRARKIWGMIFLSPWVIGFFAFTVFPIVASLFLSFTDYNLNESDQINWIGFDNYHRLLFVDPLVGTSLVVTLKFAVIALPLSIILPVALAALLNSKNLIGKRILRTMFYMPYVVPLISGVYIWQGMLNDTGWINRILEDIGIAGPRWLDDVTWIYPALNIIGLWGIGNAFLITLASMQGVPTELYEAATVDGANFFRRFRSITLPMISPVIFYNLVLSLIGLFRYFEIPYILSGGGTGQPGQSTMFYTIHLYKQAFVAKQMGYGSALAWLIFVVAFGATLLLFASARYWVYYSNEEF